MVNWIKVQYSCARDLDPVVSSTSGSRSVAYGPRA